MANIAPPKLTANFILQICLVCFIASLDAGAKCENKCENSTSKYLSDSGVGKSFLASMANPDGVPNAGGVSNSGGAPNAGGVSNSGGVLKPSDAEATARDLIANGSYVRALDALSHSPSSEMCTYYRGVCYAHLNQSKLALKQFAWLYYYGKNAQIHQSVVQYIRDLEQRKPSTDAHKTVLQNINSFQRDQLKSDESANDFFAVVRLYFDKWDTQHDGILTGDDISRALQNPNNTPEEAVALAALKTQERFDYRKDSSFAPFTLSELANLQNSLAFGDKDAKSLVRFYRTGINKVEHQTMRLFAHRLPHINGIKQGHTSDCYFLAVVGAIVTVDPEAIKRMISTNADGTYTVHLQGVSPVTVGVPTLGEIATYADSGGDGYWLTVLEKAYGIRKEELSTKGGGFVEPLDAVTIHGGNMMPVVLGLTGREGRYYSFKKEDDRQNARQIIANAESAKCLIATDVPGHCLTLIRYDRMLDQMQIWNPWGTSQYYDKAGVQMNNGFFTLPTEDFLQRFEGFCVGSI